MSDPTKARPDHAKATPLRKPKAATTSLRILFVDDEVNIQQVFHAGMTAKGHTVAVCGDGETALAVLQKDSFDCMITDFDMPKMTGIELIRHARELRPELISLLMTGKPTQENAIDAVKNHVFDYIKKPFPLNELVNTLQRVAQHRDTQRQLAALRHRVRRAEGNSRLVGDGAAMNEVRRMIDRIGPTDSAVLIRGETGSGKELVARAIHDASLRADRPMVAINCGALPENLIESELFGHCRGAFTGADAARTGLFEVADGGTLFLDEIGELPLTVQAKLLRVLESGDIRRLGDNQVLHVDVRIVCATHRDLESMVDTGTFREDLMFRINTFEVTVPSLRQRVDDIPTLATHLLRRHRSDGDDRSLFSPETLALLTSHLWPGNVRELANVIEHAAILCDSLPIRPEHLPRSFGKRQLRKDVRDAEPMSLKDLEFMAIQRAIERHDGNKPAAADELGISLKTLYNKLNSEEDRKRAA